MDNHRFDHWTRSLHAFGSRRAVTKLLAGGTFAALLAQFGREDTTAAQCIAPGKRCKAKRGKKQKCCGGAKCRGNKCQCARGREACGKRCCVKGQICAGNRCVIGQGTCPSGTDICTGVLTFCNGVEFCGCFQRLQGGTRCGQQDPVRTINDQCSSDAACRALGFPPGSSCIRDDGQCDGTNPALGACVAPCGSIPPPDPDEAIRSVLPR